MTKAEEELRRSCRIEVFAWHGNGLVELSVRDQETCLNEEEVETLVVWLQRCKQEAQELREY